MPTELPPLREKLTELPYREPCVDVITFRATKRMAVCLRANALLEGCEVSSLVRVLVDEALAARGIEQGL